MSQGRNILFKARTPLGFTVRVTRDYWTVITTIKHPVMAGCEDQVRRRWKPRKKFGVAKVTQPCIFSIAADATGVGSAL